MSVIQRSMIGILFITPIFFLVGCQGNLPYFVRGPGNSVYSHNNQGFYNGLQTYGYPSNGYAGYSNGYSQYPAYSYYAYPPYYTHHRHHHDNDRDGD
ncbi:hypothetical protein [Methylomicrobium sp. Wu6]|uniref:hypothetical protein n=1 Tax=Methylomicrobium sp. Wu6 TaxID=3107928 RepID=UPI002DD65DF8|nr:hypothetical protein [Methylomicrobium sp. Wu6]MEC4750388.1 hypothetical protein [Methylomicrobium sp. Wu6]